MKPLNRNKKVILLICALIVIVFVSIFAYNKYQEKIKVKQAVTEQSKDGKPSICQNQIAKNSNECLFIGCNGFF